MNLTHGQETTSKGTKHGHDYREHLVLPHGQRGHGCI